MYNKNEILKIIETASSVKDLEDILNHFYWLMNESGDYSNRSTIHRAGLDKYIKF